MDIGGKARWWRWEDEVMRRWGGEGVVVGKARVEKAEGPGTAAGVSG
jgi:hypothetical protein